MRKIIIITTFISFILTTSCGGLKPLESEYSYINQDLGSIDFNELGNGKVLIYNDIESDRKIGKAARLNIWIDNKALGQLNSREYVVIELESKTYLFKVNHFDVFTRSSEHKLEINNDTKIVKITSNRTTNDICATDEKPSNWDQLTYTY